jgi:fumarate hydratase class II
MKADERRCSLGVHNATAAATALIPLLGYEKVMTIRELARSKGTTIKEAAIATGFVSSEQFDAAISAEAVCRLGSLR